MKIFMTGAGGYIGGSVATGLLAAGHSIRGLTRAAATADRLKAAGIEPVVGALDDAALLAGEARQADAVINAASADHAGALRALLDGLERSGKMLIHTSGSSVIGDDARGDRASDLIFDEDTPLVVHPSKQARRDLDLLVLRAAERGVRGSVICPSLIYGTGRGLNPNSVQVPFLVANALQRGVVQVVGEGRNLWSNVHIDDVVDLYALVLAKAPAGTFCFAENGEASFRAIGEAIATRLGLAVQPLSADVAARQWGESKAYFTLGSNSRVRSRRARALGWQPRHDSVIDWIRSEMPLPGRPAA